MSIQYEKETGIFHLTTAHSSYQMQVDSYGHLLHLYYGKRTVQSAGHVLTYYDRGFCGNPGEAGMDRTYSLDVLPQEFPTRGTGDYRATALALEDTDGTDGCDFHYQSHRIYNGKYALRGLPHVYANEQEAQTLEIVLTDTVLQVQVTLLYAVLPEVDCITRSVVVQNLGERQVVVTGAASACLDFVTGSYDVLTFYGRHAMERNLERSAVGHHATVIGSRRGTSSHQYNPMMILAEKNATEEYGRCYAMSFVYSGGFEASVEMDQIDQTRMIMGLESEGLRYRLTKGQQWIIPEVIMSYSDAGLGLLSQQLHRCIRDHVCRGVYQHQVRPILINSWEANYFNIHAENLLKLAKEAADLGIEMLVMDDGWFGKRDDDNTGLGDWSVNEQKLGMSLHELTERVHSYGLKFGIWFEPEMVSEDSDLYRKHPDYAMQIPGRQPVRGRNQLILDFSREEVVDAIYEQVKQVLDRNRIEYLKWDMNRSICNVYSYSQKISGEVLYDYMLGVYRFLERLHEEYPELLIEGCSGGGGRFDAGMLYYTPQIWCSDNTDAINRTRIQYGTSFGYPISTVGSHVSAVPNHQTGRRTSMRTRATVAMAGSFGYEFDLTKLDKEEKEQIRKDIQTYKNYAPLIANGDYYRLSDPYRDEVCAWSFVSGQKEECLLSTVQLRIEGNMKPLYVRLRGLQEHAKYRNTETGEIYSADVLMEIGYPLPYIMEEYHSEQIHLALVQA